MSYGHVSRTAPSQPPKLSEEEKAKQLEQLADPTVFKLWIHARAKIPNITGKYVYCDGGGRGYNPKGHYVPYTQIKAGYKGWNICHACAEREFGGEA